MTGVAAYLRESTDRQDIATQRALARKEFAKRDIEYLEFPDDGVTGMIPFEERPEGSKIVQLVKAGTLKELIVWETSRLGRDFLDSMRTVMMLQKLGLRIFSLTDGGLLKDTNTDGFIENGIRFLINDNERRVTLRRSKEGMEFLSGAGYWLQGPAPYGYKKKYERRRADRDKDKMTPKLILNEDPIPQCPEWTEVKVVRMIYELAAEGRSCYFIRDRLQSLGIPPVSQGFLTGRAGSPISEKKRNRAAHEWSSPRVRDLIISIIYKGTHLWGKEHVAREYPNIVESGLWQRANETLKANQIHDMAHPKNKYLLTSLIKCGLCNRNYMGMPTKSGIVYYRCYGPRGDGHRPPNLPAAFLDAAVFNEIEWFRANPGTVIRLLKEQMNTGDGAGLRIAAEIRQLQAQLERNSQILENFIEELGARTISREAFKKQEQRLAEKRAIIEEQLAELGKQASLAANQTRELQKARSFLEQLKEPLTFEQRRHAVVSLVAKVVVTPVEGKVPQIRITYAFEPEARRKHNLWNAVLNANAAGVRSCCRSLRR